MKIIKAYNKDILKNKEVVQDIQKDTTRYDKIEKIWNSYHIILNNKKVFDVRVEMNAVFNIKKELELEDNIKEEYTTYSNLEIKNSDYYISNIVDSLYNVEPSYDNLESIYYELPKPYKIDKLRVSNKYKDILKSVFNAEEIKFYEISSVMMFFKDLSSNDILYKLIDISDINKIYMNEDYICNNWK